MDPKKQKAGDPASPAVQNESAAVATAPDRSIASNEPVAIPTALAQSPMLGDRVSIVTVNDGHLAATVIRVHNDRLIDLKFRNARGEFQTITKAPRDDSGRKHDSWHFAD